VIVLGLTGSIGMGKTTTAGLFAEEGAWVHDADQAVRELYGPGGAAVGPVEAAFPGAAGPAGIDRQALSRQVAGDPEALKRLEAIVHPLVARSRDEFVGQARAAGAEVVVLDVPLLFEAGQAQEVDAVVVVSAPHHVQRRRVLERPGMTAETFEALLARQMPDAEKRARADFVVDTSKGIEAARGEVRRILAAVKNPAFRP
jgi:dephospho-CoA kinase